MSPDLDAQRTAIEHITGGWRAQAVYTAVVLGIPDHVHAGRTTDAALAEATGARPDGVHRLMRLLVAMGVFAGEGDTGYRNTAVSETLLDRPGSMRDMCLLHGEQYYAAWAHASDAIPHVRSGFRAAYGTTLYEYLKEHEDVSRRFQSSMRGGNGFFHAVPTVFDFAGRHVIDLGGGSGELLTVILAAAPGARGTVFDLENVAAAARTTLPDTVAVVGGDMFDSVPRDGDVYVLSRVFAAHPDERIASLLKNIRGALPPTGRLVILDRFVTDENCALLPALWDLQLLMTVGGGHRSLADVEALLAEAGLTVERTSELPLDHVAVIAAPRG